MRHKGTLKSISRLAIASAVGGTVLSLLGCRGVLTGIGSDSADIQTYVIKQGDHYSQPAMAGVFSGIAMRFRARFDDSAVYVIEPSKQEDTNKLYGFSDCRALHQTNSIRIGWNWSPADQRIHIRAYVYRNNERRSEIFSSALPNRWNTFEIGLSDDRRSYMISHTDMVGGQKVITMDRGCDSGEFRGYRLYPYFGGTTPAPHDMLIEIEEL